MVLPVDNSANDFDSLLANTATADREVALNAMFEDCRDRLCGMVRLRLNRRISARVDPSDVVQEAFLEASKRLDDFLARRPMPFFLWLRHITGQKLIDIHRRHLGAEARDARREVSLNLGSSPGVESGVLGDHFTAGFSSPSQAALRQERKTRLIELLESLEPLDREIIAMRHFEQLSNAETAQVLGIEASAASKRYIRALQRLADVLNDFSVFSE